MLIVLPIALLIVATEPRSMSPASVALSHIRAEGALACADEGALMANVVSRLGYDPFAVVAAIYALTRIERRESGFSATLELIREGETPRIRSLRSDSTDCREITESLALALTLAIDPQFLLRDPPNVHQRQPEPARVEPPPDQKVPSELAVFAGGGASAGLSPQLAAVGSIGLGFRHGLFALYAEGRVDSPSSFNLKAGVVQTNLLIGTILPCLQWRHAAACLSLGVGALQVDGRLAFGRIPSASRVG